MKKTHQAVSPSLEKRIEVLENQMAEVLDQLREKNFDRRISRGVVRMFCSFDKLWYTNKDPKADMWITPYRKHHPQLITPIKQLRSIDKIIYIIDY